MARPIRRFDEMDGQISAVRTQEGRLSVVVTNADVNGALLSLYKVHLV